MELAGVVGIITLFFVIVCLALGNFLGVVLFGLSSACFWIVYLLK